MATPHDEIFMQVGDAIDGASTPAGGSPTAGSPSGGGPGRRIVWLVAAGVVAALVGVALATLRSNDPVTLATDWASAWEPPFAPVTAPSQQWQVDLPDGAQLDALEVVGDLVVAEFTQLDERSGHTSVVAWRHDSGERAWEHAIDWQAPVDVDPTSSTSSFDGFRWTIGPPTVHLVDDDDVTTLNGWRSMPGWQVELALDGTTGASLWRRRPVEVVDGLEWTDRWVLPTRQRSVTNVYGATWQSSEVVDLATGDVVLRRDGLIGALGDDLWTSATLSDDAVDTVAVDDDGRARTGLPSATRFTMLDDIVVSLDDGHLSGHTLAGSEQWSVRVPDADDEAFPSLWSLGDGRALLATVTWQEHAEIKDVAILSRDGTLDPLEGSPLADMPAVVDHPVVLGFGDPMLLCTDRSGDQGGCPAAVALVGLDGRTRATSNQVVSSRVEAGSSLWMPGAPTQQGLLTTVGQDGGTRLTLRNWRTLDETWQLDFDSLAWMPDTLIRVDRQGVALGHTDRADDARVTILWAS